MRFRTRLGLSFRSSATSAIVRYSSPCESHAPSTPFRCVAPIRYTWYHAYYRKTSSRLDATKSPCYLCSVPRTPDTPRVAKGYKLMQLRVPEDVHRALKVRAAESGTTMTELLVEWARRELQFEKKKGAGRR